MGQLIGGEGSDGAEDFDLVDDASGDGEDDTFPGNPFLDTKKEGEVLARFKAAMGGLPGAQIQAPRFVVDADQLVGSGITSIEDLFVAVRNENPGIAEEVIRDVVRIVSKRIVDGDASLLTPPSMDHGGTGAASIFEIKPRTIDMDAVKQAVQNGLNTEFAHVHPGLLRAPVQSVQLQVAELLRGDSDN